MGTWRWNVQSILLDDLGIGRHRLDTATLDGWEPFAVNPDDGTGPMIWLRRKEEV